MRLIKHLLGASGTARPLCSIGEPGLPTLERSTQTWDSAVAAAIVTDLRPPARGAAPRRGLTRCGRACSSQPVASMHGRG